MDTNSRPPNSSGFNDALQSGYDDSKASRAAGQSTNEASVEMGSLGDKLGTINVLGMSKTTSQDKAPTSAANLDSGGTFSPSSNLLSDPNISPALRSIELHDSALDSQAPTSQPRNVLSGINSSLGKPSPLKHKDSFGHHHFNASTTPDTSNTSTGPSQTTEGIAKEIEKKLYAPAAFVSSLWGSDKGSENSPTTTQRPTGSNAGLAVSNTATLGGPVSPFTNKDEESSMVVEVAGDIASRNNRNAEQESTPKKSAARQHISNKIAASNGQTNAGPSVASPSTVVGIAGNPAIPMRPGPGGHTKSSRLGPHRPGPQLPSAPNVTSAPPPAMYWSRVPVHGSVPRRSFRAHTANLADEVLWLFGGCDSKGCFRELWCFDTETMCWSKPKVTGDLPPPRRAHSATMVDKRLFIFAGGDGPYYFNDLYVFDTISLRWSKPDVYGQPPTPRRAHTSNYYNGQLIIFGGGNGVGALNDVFSLDIADPGRLEWKKVECKGKVPIGRGYHTSSLVDGKLIVIGGSDGHMSFNDIHILRLDTKVWYQVKTDEIHNRLGHTATQVGSYLFVVGGHDSHSYTPEILTLNLVNLQWEPRRVCGKKPPGRGYHQAWLRDSRLFVHGGFDGKEIYDDLYFIDLAACAYLPQITSFSVELDDE